MLQYLFRLFCYLELLPTMWGTHTLYTIAFQFMYTLEIDIELGTFMSSLIHKGTLVYLELRLKLKLF